MPQLSDGTVVPHYMGVRNNTARQQPLGFFDEVRLLVGEVTDILYPDNENNTTGDTEYIVNVWRRKGNGAQERIAFHCFQADAFGSVADWFRFSFRAADADEENTPLSNGATVLVACINGDRSQAYIVGAIPQPNREKVDPDSAEGRYLRGRFNGVEVSIQDDGSFEMTVPGAVKTDGTPDDKRDENNHGSKVTFAANGDIVIDDQNGESITVSPGNKTIVIESSDTILATAEKNITATAGEDASLTVGKNTDIETGERLSEKSDQHEVDASSSWRVRTGHASISSSDVNLGADKTSPTNGVVFGEGIDTFTGLPYFALGNASKTVKTTK